MHTASAVQFTTQGPLNPDSSDPWARSKSLALLGVAPRQKKKFSYFDYTKFVAQNQEHGCTGLTTVNMLLSNCDRTLVRCFARELLLGFSLRSNWLIRS